MAGRESSLLDYFREALSAQREASDCGDALNELRLLDGPARISILELLLSSSVGTWRRAALRCVSGDTLELLPRVKDVLRGDVDPMVREEAASTLGRMSAWPEAALLDSLEDDPDEVVRASALAASLEQGGLDRSVIDHEFDLCVDGKTKPDRSYVAALFRKHRGTIAEREEPSEVDDEAELQLKPGFARRHIVAWDLIERQILSEVQGKPLAQVIQWLTRRLHPPVGLDPAGVQTAVADYLDAAFNDIDNAWVGPEPLLSEHARSSGAPSPFVPRPLSPVEVKEVEWEVDLLAGFTSYYEGLEGDLPAVTRGEMAPSAIGVQCRVDWRRAGWLIEALRLTATEDGSTEALTATLGRLEGARLVLDVPKQRPPTFPLEPEKALAQLRLATVEEADEDAARLVALLCATRFVPALDEFATWIRHERPSWRVLGIRALTSADSLASERVELLRSMLATDADPRARAAAATALALHSRWPDPALTDRIRTEGDAMVRLRVFEATLLLAGLPYVRVQTELDRVERGEVIVNEASIELATQSYADSLSGA